MLKYSTVLALIAHPDDELSCAGTLARFAEEGANVYIASLALPDLDRSGSVMNKGSERLQEFSNSVKSLGIPNTPACLSFDEEDFSWTQKWVRHLDSMVDFTQFDLVITQRLNDTQQTHSHLSRIVNTLGRKNRLSIWEMDQPLPGGWETDGPRPNLLVNISDQIDKKINAIQSYQSQLERYPNLKDALLDRDKYHAWLMNMEGQRDVKYAEAFRIRKEVWL